MAIISTIIITCTCKKIWDANWGELYAKDMPRDYVGKIQKLQDEIDKLPSARMMTLSQMSFKPVKPYDEWHDFKRRSKSRTEKVECDYGT